MYYLYWNVFFNKVKKNVLIIALPLLNSSKVKKFNFRDLTPGCAKNYIEETRNKSHKNLSFNNLCINLDYLIKTYKLPPPSKIKIDVDGNEMSILKGLTKNIKSVNEIYIETMQENSNESKKINNFLKKNKFFLVKSFNQNKLYKKFK